MIHTLRYVLSSYRTSVQLYFLYNHTSVLVYNTYVNVQIKSIIWQTVKKLKAYSPETKRQTVITAKWCLNCSSLEHFVRECPYPSKCRKCGPDSKKHSILVLRINAITDQSSGLLGMVKPKLLLTLMLKSTWMLMNWIILKRRIKLMRLQIEWFWYARVQSTLLILWRVNQRVHMPNMT